MRKILAIFILLLIGCWLLVSSPVHAQDNWLEQTPQARGEALDEARSGKINMEAYWQKASRETVASLNCDIGGVGCSRPCTEEEHQKGICQSFNQSALGGTTKLIAQIYAMPPASGGVWLADLIQNAGLIPKAYAQQGLGFAGLSPILPIWKVFRNIAYTILVIVLIVIGFMVMFRMKIDPKTVISIQQALPKIVLTLLLITFSYPIAGFLIDLMYFLIMLSIAALGPDLLCPGGSCTVAQFQQNYITGGFVQLASSVFGFIPGELWLKSIAWAAGFALLPVLGLIGTVGMGGAAVGSFFTTEVLQSLLGGLFFGGAAGVATGPDWGNLISGAISPLLLIILLLALLFTFIRLFLLLLNCYIQILIAIIFGPLQLLFEAIPGQSAFSGWLKGLISNLIVFPTVVLLLIIGHVIITQIGKGGALWSPPLLPGWSSDMSRALIGLGFAMMIPSLASAVKDAFKAKPAIPISAGSAITPLTTGVQTGLGVASQFYYGSQFLGMIPFFKKKEERR